MSERFANLKKIPEGPAARLLSENNTKLDTKLDAPVSASVSDVLSELDAKGASLDMIKVISASLPPRECIWWACLSAHDVPVKETSPVLKAAEAWVFKPTDENRAKLKQMLDLADPMDNQVLVGTAAYYGDGTLGLDDLKDQPAPPGVVAICCFGQGMNGLEGKEDAEAYFQLLIDRALDIARGGNGRLESKSGDLPKEAGEKAST